MVRKRLTELSPQRRALVERLLGERAASSKPPAVLLRHARAIAPLSYVQQRLWLLDQLTHSSAPYVETNVVPLNFHPRRDVLERTINEIVRRHETLRTNFQIIDGQPVQVIHPSHFVPLRVVDLRLVPSTSRSGEIRRIAAAEAQKIQDITKDPLVRTVLLIGEEEDLLLLNMHHILCDSWSIGLLIWELTCLYPALAVGRPSPLAELPIQYADYAIWQREWLSGNVLADQLDYWKKQLVDIPVLQLPTDHPRPPLQTYRGATREFAIPGHVCLALKELCQREGVTLFMIFLAAFQILLHHYAGQDDIVVGIPISNRNRAELANVIGFFVNTLVLRSKLSGDPTFRRFLAGVRDTALAAYAHQDLPFERLVEELKPERDMSRNPLFQVVFQQISVLNSNGIGPEQMLPVHRVDVGTAKFDLRLDLLETAAGCDGFFEYSTDLFETSTIDRMIEHYVRLLQSILQGPDRPISELPFLTEAEMSRLLTDWNRTEEPGPESTVHEMFEARAAERPDATGIECAHGVLSYRELNERANRLAHYLGVCGVGPGATVAISMDRCHDWVIALLAILKVGGAYVPLDPGLPRERLTWMIADAGVKWVLARGASRSLLSGSSGSTVRMLDIDELQSDLQSMPRTAPKPRSSPNSLAYIIYTSGSTGRPKGVLVGHRGLSNVVAEQERILKVGRLSRVLQFASMSFDASIFEIFLALAAGGALCIAPPEILAGAPLAEFLRSHSISIVTLPPSVLAATPADDLPALETVTVAGEVCPANLVARWANKRRFFNLYGPTEATIWSTFMECDKDSATGPPIGRPIQHIMIYILDVYQRPVPVGVQGELYIGGIGVAHGYLNLPELTKERFVELTFGGGKQRLYRTGDLARYLPNGNIEYLGRSDHQVKIHGFRIELGEIEKALCLMPEVSDAAVTVRKDHSGDPGLVAYITQAERSLPTSDRAISESAEAQLCSWKRLYDDTYEQTKESDDPSLNLIGWNSSYTGQPIPEPEMREQVKHTVERVLSLVPQNVLEIGCGTGLLLLRLGPKCQRYVATDFSPKALDYVRRQLHKSDLRKIELLERLADDFNGFPEGSFDAVVLNSVVQYFPDVDYLYRVLAGALQVVGDHGCIFIGDVRNLPLLELFHTSVELERSPDTLSTAELQERVRQRMSEERELVIDPRLFLALRKRYPQVCGVSIQPRRGRYQNELTRFRYDVTLEIGGESGVDISRKTCSWDRIGSLGELRSLLGQLDGCALQVEDIPNARLDTEIRALDLLSRADGPQSVGQLRCELEQCTPIGIEPESVLDLIKGLPYQAHLGYAWSRRWDRYDVLFIPRSERRTSCALDFPCKASPGSLDDSGPYTNSPLAPRRREMLLSQVRKHLREILPGYMIPSLFVLLDQMPLTPSGKINRRALPAPDQRRPELSRTYVGPQTATERLIADAWREVLGVNAVGMDDNFFDLGGHSLLLVRLHVRLEETLGVGSSIVDLFRYPTIRSFARFLERQAASDGGGLRPGTDAKRTVASENIPSAWRTAGSSHV